MYGIKLQRPMLGCSACPGQSFHYIYDFTAHLKVIFFWYYGGYLRIGGYSIIDIMLLFHPFFYPLQKFGGVAHGKPTLLSNE